MKVRVICLRAAVAIALAAFLGCEAERKAPSNPETAAHTERIGEGVFETTIFEGGKAVARMRTVASTDAPQSALYVDPEGETLERLSDRIPTSASRLADGVPITLADLDQVVGDEATTIEYLGESAATAWEVLSSEETWERLSDAEDSGYVEKHGFLTVCWDLEPTDLCPYGRSACVWLFGVDVHCYR